MQISPTPAAKQSSVLFPKCENRVRTGRKRNSISSRFISYWVGCPYWDYFWRGDSTEDSNKHLLKMHRRNLSNFEKQYGIYDRDYILHFIQVLDQRQSVEMVAGYPLDFVGEKAPSPQGQGYG
jgi:hypothetical protein